MSDEEGKKEEMKRDKNYHYTRRRKHNKSKNPNLSLLKFEEDVLFAALEGTGSHQVQGLMRDSSKCKVLKPKDGRVSHLQRKMAFGYQIVALQKFGREEMSKIASSKRSDDLTISHLCGTENCCNPDHLILEEKRINDDRTHCHHVMRNIIRNNGESPSRLEEFFNLNACPHKPQCGNKM